MAKQGHARMPQSRLKSRRGTRAPKLLSHPSAPDHQHGWRTKLTRLQAVSKEETRL
jgi:hypothetical protein